MWAGAIVGVVLIVCLGGYVLKGALGERRLSEPKDEARASVAVAAQESDRIKGQVEINRATLGQPLQSWSQVVCELDGYRSGWFVDSYSQQCRFSQIDVYPITDHDRAIELREAHPGVAVSYSTSPSSWPKPEPVEKGEFSNSPRGTPPQWDVHGDLSGDRLTIVSVNSEPVVTELGCSPWGIAVCFSPVDAPVMP